MIRPAAFALAALTMFFTAGAADALDIPENTWEFHRAQTAIQEGAYGKALPTLRDFAQQGNASSQWLLGDFYKNGTGVGQDLEIAAMWYRKAIEKAPATIPADPPEPSIVDDEDWALAVRHLERLRTMCPVVTATLGAMYFRGEGVPKDAIEAYKWFQLADGYGHPKAGLVVDVIADDLSGDQLAEARQRVRDWMADHRRFEDGIVERYLP